MSAPTPSLRLYNTLTRQKEDFQPLDPTNVRMYVCGPTVYDFAHIGNARPVIVFDVLYRLLRHLYGADHVTYVRNITDVDDKINARAGRDFPGMPLNDAIRQVTEKTANQFFEDVKALGCLPPTHQPRATENIAQMAEIINQLLAKGHAYIASGNEGREVLFSISSMKDYGQLSKRNLDDQQAGARINVEAHKRDAGDFVLWKESAPTEPGWHADFVEAGATVSIFGRPGWHIECSAMSNRYLGETFDIHGGGLDLIFPHHENEIAQSRCAFGHDVMAKVWMHNGFLQVEGEKMSKSLGNFVTINELLHTDKFGLNMWHGSVLRLSMLMTHYRQPVDWTASRLVEARETLHEWIKLASGWDIDFEHIPPEFLIALCDDLNTSSALSILHGLRRKLGQQSDPDLFKALAACLSFLGLWNGESPLDVYGYGYSVKDGPADIDIPGYIKARSQARANKDWAEADRIRQLLTSYNIVLKDGKDPVTGEPTTTWEVKA